MSEFAVQASSYASRGICVHTGLLVELLPAACPTTPQRAVLSAHLRYQLELAQSWHKGIVAFGRPRLVIMSLIRAWHAKKLSGHVACMNIRISMHVKGRMYISTFRAPAVGYARVNSGHGKNTAERTFQTHSYSPALGSAFFWGATSLGDSPSASRSPWSSPAGFFSFFSSDSLKLSNSKGFVTSPK